MSMSRRALGAMTGALALGLVAGCSRSPKEQAADRLEWLRGLDGVAKAEYVTPPDDDDGDDEPMALLTLSKGLHDRGVRYLVGTVRQHWAGHDDGYNTDIELDIDGFRAQFYPSLVTKTAPDVDRALWLRRDGRATDSVYGPSGLVVTAPPASVAAVALGLDRVDRVSVSRDQQRIESADRSVVVEWTDEPGHGLGRNRAAVTRFAELQKRFPHLTGWFADDDGGRAGLYFSPDDIDFDDLLAALRSGHGPSDVDTGPFPTLELGWGPARASREIFATAFTGKLRTVLDRLATIPGVTGFRVSDDSGDVKPESVTVADRAGYLAVLPALRAVWDQYLSIQLVRKPTRFLGQEGDWVFEGSIYDGKREQHVHATVADLGGVQRVQVGPESANLIVTPDISGTQLATTLAAMATLPAANTIDMFARPADSLDLTTVGTVTDRRFAAAPSGPHRASRALITRIGTAWDRATHS
ncbi:MAG: hypothetical protein WCA46_06700 [Actinocatenispora sp.]